MDTQTKTKDRSKIKLDQSREKIKHRFRKVSDFFLKIKKQEKKRGKRIKQKEVHVANEKSVLKRGNGCFLKCFFILKHIKIIYFLFFKIIFDINISKY